MYKNKKQPPLTALWKRSISFVRLYEESSVLDFAGRKRVSNLAISQFLMCILQCTCKAFRDGKTEKGSALEFYDFLSGTRCSDEAK